MHCASTCHMDVATAEGREVSRSHVSDSPVPGESRMSRTPANATTGNVVAGPSAKQDSAADEQSGQTKNTEESLIQ